MAVTKMKDTSVKAAESKLKILGTFEGECMDTTITNLNGLDITAEVMKGVFESDDYKQGITNGWYIGFLGHPEDPNCMAFQDACIVMTEGRLDDNGKVFGKFNLVDTPVGRIVKAFQDAGVKFGISIRGAGDIENNSVDPETFVFRGFDLVSFPAFPDSIPTFTEIAASTDTKVRSQYKKICAAVSNNIDRLNSEAIDVIQPLFATQSKEHKLLEDRKQAITSAEIIALNNDKVVAMTELYLESLEANKQLTVENEKLRRQISSVQIAADKKLKVIKRIVGNQILNITDDRDKLYTENQQLIQANTSLEEKLSISSDTSKYDTIIANLRQDLIRIKKENKDYILANRALSTQITKSGKENLIYKRKIESHSKQLEDKDKVIADLQFDLDETVNGMSDLEIQASNLGEDNRKAKLEVKAAQRLVRAYQNAYANLYASAVGSGSDIKSLSITSSTTVSELQQMISGTAQLANMSNVFVEPQPVEFIDDGDTDDNEIITL